MNPLLISIRLSIPGEWADAWLYKGHVLLWDRNGLMFLARLEDVRSEVVSIAGEDIAVLTDLLILRNDWKLDQPFPQLMHLSGLSDALFHRMGAPDLVLPLNDLEIVPLASDPAYEGFLLDTAIYADRVFAATDLGIYETSVNFASRKKDPVVQQVCDSWTRSIGARGARIVASLGEKGLVSRPIAMGRKWWDDGTQSRLPVIDDYSLDSSFAHFSVLNYRGGPAPSFLHAHTEPDRSILPGKPTTVVRSYSAGVSLESELHRALSHASHSSAYDQSDDLRVVGNSNNRMLVAGSFGHAVVELSPPRKRSPLRLSMSAGFEVEGVDRYLGAPPNATHAVRSGFVIEDFHRTGLITSAGAYDLIDEPTARVRSFPSAIRYADCVTAVFDTRVDLIGYFEPTNI